MWRVGLNQWLHVKLYLIQVKDVKKEHYTLPNCGRDELYTLLKLLFYYITYYIC